jgi:hypothetical protein
VHSAEDAVKKPRSRVAEEVGGLPEVGDQRRSEDLFAFQKFVENANEIELADQIEVQNVVQKVST